MRKSQQITQIMKFMLLFLFLIAGCTAVSTSRMPYVHAIEVEGTYDISFKSAMSYLQKMNYTIDEADLETGFIKASRPAEITEGKKALAFMLAGPAATDFYWYMNITFEKLTDSRTVLRVQFMSVILDNWGRQTSRDYLTDEEYFNTFGQNLQNEIYSKSKDRQSDEIHELDKIHRGVD